MTMDTKTEPNADDPGRLIEALQSLRDEVRRLGERVAALEARSQPAPVPAAIAPSPAETISDEILIAISAAIAAYLGVKPRIRQIRLLRSAGWAQQGRITIQASHRLARAER